MSTATIGTEKKSFTIKKDYTQKLNLYKNKSKVVNEALRMYFAREEFLKEAEEEFFANFEFENLPLSAQVKLEKISDKLDEI